MSKHFLLTPLLLLAAFASAFAQTSPRKADDGRSIREFIFVGGQPASLKSAAPKPKEATITSKASLRQHLFPGSNGGGIPRSAATGARKAATNSAAANQLPSNMSATEAAQKAKTDAAAKAAAKPVDPAAQGKEPSLHYDTPKATTPKN